MNKLFLALPISLIFLCCVNTTKAQTKDIKLESLILPQPKFGMTDQELISIVVKNNGTEALSEFPVYITITGPENSVSFSEIINSNLSSGEKGTYTLNKTLDFNAEGVYDIQVETQLEGDHNNENDIALGKTLKFTRYNGGFPFEENFDDISIHTDIYTGNSALPGASFFTNDKENYLSVRNGTYSASSGALLSAKNGTEASLVYTLNLSSDPRDFFMYFKLDEAFTNFGEVMVRGSENDEWIWLLTADKVVQSNTDSSASNELHLFFRNYNLTEILNEAGQQLTSATQIMFRLPSGGLDQWNYHTMNISQIKFWHREDNEIGLKNIWPNDLHRESELTFKLTNNGKYEQKNIPVTVEFEGPEETFTITSTVEEVLPPDSYRLHTIPYNLPERGDYNVKLYAQLPDDGFRLNDTLKSKISKPKIYDGYFPYKQDFENVGELYVQESTTEIEKLPGFTFVTDVGVLTTEFNSKSASNILKIKNDFINGDYIINNLIFTADLSSFTEMESLIVSFDADPCSDFYYRGNENEEWIQVVLPSGDGNFSMDILSSLNSQDHNIGSTFQIAFTENYTGIDNLIIKPVVPQKIDLKRIIAPLNDRIWSSEENLQVELLNQGQLIEEDFPLVIEVTDAMGTYKVEEEVISETILPGESRILPLKTAFDFSANSYYSIKIYLDLPTNLGSDTIYTEINRRGEVVSGIDSGVSNKLILYPNPTDGVLNITSEKIEIQELQVFNAAGKYLKKSKTTDSIDLSHYNPGSYFIKIITNEGVIFRKVSLD